MSIILTEFSENLTNHCTDTNLQPLLTSSLSSSNSNTTTPTSLSISSASPLFSSKPSQHTAQTTTPPSIPKIQQTMPQPLLPRRTFNPNRNRRYGRPTFSPATLVRWSPKWKFRRLFNFPFVGSHFRPRMHTLVVSIDGGCRVNDRSKGAIANRAACAVYFGPGSDDNAAKKLIDIDVDVERGGGGGVGGGGIITTNTNNRAELHAGILAMEILQRKIEEGEDEIADMVHEVIVMTDSTYVHQSVSSWVWKWERNGWRTVSGGTVQNQDLIRRLHGLIKLFEDEYGISVRFWKVAREWNEEADEMVNEVLDGKLSGT